MPPLDRPQTLADYLAEALPQTSPRARQRLIRFGRIRINGQPAAQLDQPVNPGDDVAILPPATAPHSSSSSSPPAGAPVSGRRPPRDDIGAVRERPRPPRSPAFSQRPPRPRSGGAREWDRSRPPPPSRRERPRGLEVVHEDDDIIVVDKPPGMLTASPTPVREPTLLDQVKDHLRETATRGEPGRGRRRAERTRLGVIHRLDKEASGLLVFSKTDRAFEWLKEDFRARRVHRMYLALVEGIAGEVGASGTIQSFLREMPGGKVISIPADEYRGPAGGAGAERGPGAARLAVTHYRVLAASAAAGLSLLQVRLETGRKHQIRVHLAGRGHPIAGDHRYGARTDPLRRLGLHAAELGFTHFQTGQSHRFTSPAPAGFYRAVGLTPPAAPARPEPPPPPSAQKRAAAETSWDDVADWYDQMLEGGPGGRPGGRAGEGRSDHYEQVILPGAMRLLAPQAGETLLDVACGQGILARRLSSVGCQVTGVEASPSLVEAAEHRSRDLAPPIRYLVGDARDLARLELPRDFAAAACIMALANIDPLEPVLSGVARHLAPGGRFVAVISHPAFRAPGQTAWGWDDTQRRQYRRIEGYLSPGQHRIQMHPGSDPSVSTWTFHRPIQAYVQAFAAAGLLIDAMEEWPGQRTSTSGPRAAEENRIRREIPLFLAIRATKPRA